MLVLSRRPGESIRIGDDIVVTVVETDGDRARLAIRIGDDIVVTVVETDGGRARLAIQAPPGVPVVRTELLRVPVWEEE